MRPRQVQQCYFQLPILLVSAQEYLTLHPLVPTIRPPPHNCGRGSMPAFRHVTQPREGEVATPHLPSTCTGNNQCLYPFPVALRLPQIETTIFAVSALYNETVSGPFRDHRAYPSAVMHHSCEFEYSVDEYGDLLLETPRTSLVVDDDFCMPRYNP